MINLKIQFPAPGDTILQDMARLSPEVPKAIKRGLDFGMQLLISLIRSERLSGKGPYPPSQHRLGTRTGQLQAALHANPAVIRGTSVSAEIVNPVIYAGVHEYGMVITAKKRLMRFQIEGKWIMAHEVVIPERAPVRYGLERRGNVISEAIMDEVNETVNKLIKK